MLLADLRDTLFQGDPFNPAVLPASQMRKSSLSGALPYVLFSEEGDLTTRITIRSLPANLEWVRAPSKRAPHSSSVPGMVMFCRPVLRCLPAATAQP